MIAFLSGKILSKNLRSIVVLVGGVGYRVHMPLGDLAKISDQDGLVGLHIHTNVKEDSIELFGFLNEDSLFLFEQLISVTGVGPKIALATLSGMAPSEFSLLIETGDHQSITRIPGIGSKTAQRLVLELKDKLKQVQLPQKSSTPTQTLSDLRSAIMNLGYKPAVIEKAIKATEPLAKSGQPLEALVREALRHLN